MIDEPELCYVSHDAFLAQVVLVAEAVRQGVLPDFVVGVGRGGLVPAVYLSHRLDVPMLSIDQSSGVADFAEALLATIARRSAQGTRLLIVDDINDSGGTIAGIRSLLAANGCADDNLRFAVLIHNLRSRVAVDHWADTIDRAEDKRWFVFPWEAVADHAALVDAARAVPERLA